MSKNDENDSRQLLFIVRRKIYDCKFMIYDLIKINLKKNTESTGYYIS